MKCFIFWNRRAAWLVFSFLICSLKSENLAPLGASFEAGFDRYEAKIITDPIHFSGVIKPEIDRTTGAVGRNSLKLSNTTGHEIIHLFTGGIPMNSGEATLSFYAKGDTPESTIRLILMNGNRVLMEQTCKLTSEWQRYSVTTTPEKWSAASGGLEKMNYIHIRTTKNNSWKTIWVDGVQLEMGKLSDYQDPAPVDLSFEMDRELKVYRPDETPKLTLRAAAAGIAGKQVSVQVEELFSKVKEKEILVTLNPEGDSNHGLAVIPMSPRPRGAYRVTVTVPQTQSIHWQCFGVIQSMAHRPAASKKFYGGSIETIMPIPDYLEGPVTDGHTLHVWKCDPVKSFELAKEMGWGWWHSYWAISLNTIMPTSGSTAYWEDADYFVQLAEKNGLEIYANLMGMGHLNEDSPPEWSRGSLVSDGGTWGGKGQRLPDAEKFASFARAAAKRYKGRIKMWEPFNEPGVKMREHHYVPLQDAVYKALKEVDSSNFIYGLCGTKDVGGDLYGWVKGCLKLGAASSMDGIAIHGYHVDSRDYIEKTRQIGKELGGKDFPIVDSETGYIRVSQYPYALNAINFGDKRLESLTSDANAHKVVSHLADCLAYGAERQSFLSLVDYVDGIKCHSMTMFEHDGAPNMALVAYNVFVDRLGLGKFKKKISIGGEIVIYLFDVEGRGEAVLWADALPKHLDIPILSERVEFLNLGGMVEKFDKTDRSIKVSLGSQLCYLTGKSLSTSELEQILQKASIIGQNGVDITRVGLIQNDEGKASLGVSLLGTSSTPQSFGLEVAQLPEPWKISSNRVESPGLKIDEAKTFYFPLISGMTQSIQKPIKILLDGQKASSTKKFNLKSWVSNKVSTPVMINGDLSEWDSKKFIAVSQQISASIQWDLKGFYLAVKAQDKTVPDPKIEKEIFHTDCIEVFVNSSTANSFKDRNFSSKDSQFICSVRGMSSENTVKVYSGPRSLSEKPRDFHGEMKNKISVEGYTAEIFIPWDDVFKGYNPSSEGYLGFDLSVHDVDQSHNSFSRAIWAGDEQNWKFTDQYGVLLLGE